jgi:hypothetical protein
VPPPAAPQPRNPLTRARAPAVDSDAAAQACRARGASEALRLPPRRLQPAPGPGRRCAALPARGRRPPSVIGAEALRRARRPRAPPSRGVRGSGCQARPSQRNQIPPQLEPGRDPARSPRVAQRAAQPDPQAVSMAGGRGGRPPLRQPLRQSLRTIGASRPRPAARHRGCLPLVTAATATHSETGVRAHYEARIKTRSESHAPAPYYAVHANRAAPGPAGSGRRQGGRAEEAGKRAPPRRRRSVGSGRRLGLAGAEGGEGDVGRLLARHEHRPEGRAHAGGRVLARGHTIESENAAARQTRTGRSGRRGTRGKVEQDRRRRAVKSAAGGRGWRGRHRLGQLHASEDDARHDLARVVDDLVLRLPRAGGSRASAR